MKWLKAILSLFLCAIVFWGLNNRHGLFPSLGKLTNPFSGFWQNGTGSDTPPSELVFPELRDKVQIFWDANLIPHIFAQNEADLFFAQGYVAAYLRLWQMEFQVLYAAGRLSEIFGKIALEHDRYQRRFGLPWSAEKAIEGFFDDPKTKSIIESYTAGVNAFIRSLNVSRLPLEYKILDYKPEKWSPVKCALLLNYMRYMLTGENRDVSLTELRDALGEKVVDELFPVFPPLAEPVIPPGTRFDFKHQPTAQRTADSKSKPQPQREEKLLPLASRNISVDKNKNLNFNLAPFKGIGSNNWAVSGRLTESGFPILADDMHLALNLPIVWYVIQLVSPEMNVMGVSIPGTPLVVVGFNNHIAWGFTNAGSDVLDWYALKFKDETRQEYLSGADFKKTWIRQEKIKVRDSKTLEETVLFTHIGPVVRLKGEPPFSSAEVPEDASLRWAGHEKSNELQALYLLNRARSYSDYLEAIENWDCPAQNIVYADREGNIAIWHAGKFPVRTEGSSTYILDGTKPEEEWQGWIPRLELPHVLNPDRGFVSSANQLPADKNYPYYLGRDYAGFERGARINERLQTLKNIKPEDMVQLQSDVLDIRARTVLPIWLELLATQNLTETEKTYFTELKNWNYEARSNSAGPTIFNAWWQEFMKLTWNDEKLTDKKPMPWPSSEVMITLVMNKPDSEFFDDRTTEDRETAAEIIVKSFSQAVAYIEKKSAGNKDKLKWGRVKNTRLQHLGRMPGLGIEFLDTDGIGRAINAISSSWGPSWRVVVELGPQVRAWGIYPGGQSGNPGSRFYDNLVSDWAKGQPHELVFLQSAEENNPNIKHMTRIRPKND